MDERAGDRRPAPGELIDRGDGGHKIPSGAAVFFINGQAANTKPGELAEDIHREGALAVPAAYVFAPHFALDKAPQALA